MFDMNDAEPQKSGELIPDGSFAKVAMTIRPGGIDGQSEIDQGLLKAPNDPSSDVLMLDCEFTVVEGPHAKRKFWQMFTVQGGKVDENGVSIAWKISKSTFRAMIDSALGLDPQDMSEAAKQKRILRGLADLNGITFVAKIKVEASEDARYSDQNRLDRVVLPTEKEWKLVMDGKDVPASPSRSRASARRTLPLVVRGIVPGAVTTTRSSSSPALSRMRRATCSTTSSRARPARASTTATTSSAPVGRLMPNTTTPVERSPGRSAIAASRSGGWYLRPCRMIRSLIRPQTNSSPPAR